MADEPTTPNPEAGPPAEGVAQDVAQTQDNIDNLQNQLDNQDLTPAQRDKLEAKVDVLEGKLDKLVTILDKMAAAPVAPSPRKTTQPVKADTTPTPDAPSGTPASEPKRKRGRFHSSYWQSHGE